LEEDIEIIKANPEEMGLVIRAIAEETLVQVKELIATYEAEKTEVLAQIEEAERNNS